MNDEQRLREILSAALPDAPSSPDRAAGARALASARHRRTTIVGTALGVAAVVAAIAVPVALSRDEGARPTDPAPAASSSTVAAEDDFSCPPVPPRGETAAPVTGPDELPGGAVAVRICDSGGLFGDPPRDALTTRVAAVSSSIDALPPADKCKVIPLDSGPTWDLVFLYPDGHTQTVRGATHGCGGVQVGSTLRGGREDADRPFQLLQRLLWEQRLSTQPADVRVTPPRCGDGNSESGPGLTTMPLQHPLTMESAVLCWRFETESEQPTQQAALSDADLATLLDDLNHNRTDREITAQECTEPDMAHYEIIGVNAWGDRLSLEGFCGAFDLSGSNSDIWRPNAASQAILDRLVDANPTVLLDPDDRTPPDQVLSIWADLRNAGERARADALWVDPPAIPDGLRVDVKTEEVRSVQPDPGTPEAAYRIVSQVTSLYRLDPADGSWVDYHEVRFTLGRDNLGMPWRILSMTDLGVVPTGR